MTNKKHKTVIDVFNNQTVINMKHLAKPNKTLMVLFFYVLPALMLWFMGILPYGL